MKHLIVITVQHIKGEATVKRNVGVVGPGPVQGYTRIQRHSEGCTEKSDTASGKTYSLNPIIFGLNFAFCIDFLTFVYLGC